MGQTENEKSPPLPSPQTQPPAQEEEWILVPPDGGRGWFILAGTLLINILIPGTIKSFGVLFVEFIEVFKTSPFVASWIPAICYFLYCSIGPLTTYLSIKTSYRTVTIAGGVFAALGMILSCFATSIIYLYVSFGILVGLGAGLSFPPGIYLCTSYFLKRRGLANGLAISGSAFGSIILPPFLRFLLEYYGYRGAVLIMGGLTLNVIVGALMYEPVEKHMKRVKVIKEISSTDATTDTDKDKTVIEKPPVSEKTSEPVYILNGHRRDEESGMPLLTQPSLGTRKISAPAYRGPGRKVSTASFGGRLMGSTGQIVRKTSGYTSPMMLGSTGHVAGMSRNYSIASNMSSSSLRYVSTAFHGSTLVGLNPEFTSNPNLQHRENKWYWCCGKPKDESKKTIKKAKETDDKKTAGVSLALLKDPIYLVILCCNATSAIGYVNFTILVPAYAQSLGYNKDLASYLLSIIACTDLIGRIGGATLSDILKLDKRVYYIGGFLISGISLALLPLVSDSYNLLSAFCALFGLASGIYVGITAVMMAEILGEDLLASSYGIALFVNGVLQLIGPPICGAIYQQIDDYNPIATGLGVTLILGASIWLIVPFLNKKSES